MFSVYFAVIVSPTLSASKRVTSGGATTKTISPLGFFSVTRREVRSIAVTDAVSVIVSPAMVLICAWASTGIITAAASIPARIRVMVFRFSCESPGAALTS
jgi:hypothetical protein